MMTKDLFNGLCDEIQAQKDLLFDYKKENIELKQQLQAHKDKEDKALKYMKDNSSNGNVDVSGVGCDTTDDFDIQELSQILNEGSEE